MASLTRSCFPVPGRLDTDMAESGGRGSKVGSEKVELMLRDVAVRNLRKIFIYNIYHQLLRIGIPKAVHVHVYM